MSASLSHEWRAGSSLLRSLLFSPLAVLLAVGFFLGLSQLTLPDQQEQSNLIETPQLDLLLAPRDSEVKVRSRKPPPKPIQKSRPKVFEPDLPKPSEVTSLDVAVEISDVPAIDFDLDVEVGLDIPNLPTASLEVKSDAPVVPIRNNPRILKNVVPRYPSRAQRRRIEGTLVAEFTIKKDGYVDPGTIQFIQADPEDVFEKSVIRSIKRSRFEPVLVNGNAVEYRARKLYKFVMPE
ncbi:MAG: TonB family protein [Pseudomonadota bacterium]